MVRFSGEVLIDRSVEEVFDFVADERNRYDPRVRNAELLTDAPIGRGTRFRSESTSMGRPVAMIVEITEYQRPERLSTTTRLSGMEIDSELRFAPAPAGTRLAWTSQVRLQGLLKLFSPVVRIVGRRRTASIWSGLESTFAASGAAPSSRR